MSLPPCGTAGRPRLYASICALTIALWPASEADKARADGESDSDWDQALYEYELEVAVDDLATQAEDFRTQGPEVHQAFWEGYDESIANA